MQFDRQEWKFDPIGELRDMVKNMDAVVDDFMMKKMGNGEVFVCVCVGGGGEFGRRVTDTDYQLRFSLSTCLVHPFFPCRPLCMWLWICKQNNEFEASRAG